MKINIPQIYEEDIIEFTQKKGDVILKYNDGDSVFQIVFKNAYTFDYCEFDYMRNEKWIFGLDLINDSEYVKELTHNMTADKLQRAFGGEYHELRHYRLVIDDVGIYNIICKKIMLEYVVK